VSEFDNLRNEAEKFAREHPDDVKKYADEAIQRGGQTVDRATGDKHEHLVSEGEDYAERFADERLGGEHEQPS
jgi:hypothetical protein